ncbi:MAG: hypothetical protein ACOC9J_03525 [Persicimonas sp.]
MMLSNLDVRHHLVCLAILVVSLLPAAVHAQQQEAQETPAESTRADGDSAEQLLEEAADIAVEVAEIRGLELKRGINKGIRDRDELRKVLIERLAEEVSDEDVEREGMVFKKLGLMPDDLDYKQTLLDVLTEQIAGFYDQHAEELYIMQGIPLDLQRPAMAHEIFHAIQDQHFDIQRMVEPLSSKEHGDFALARSALIEGDASVLMIDFSLYEEGILPREGVESVVDIPLMANVLKQLTREDVGALQQMVPEGSSQGAAPIDPSQLADSALAGAPRVIRKLLVFPYFGGMRFVISARADHGWDRVNAVYENPPVSTEQILHPERYFAGDQPVRLDFDAQPVLDAEQTYDSVFGEYQMRLLLEEHLLDEDGDQAESQRAYIDRAMLGWDGDRLRAFEYEDERVLLTHLSVWDTFKDAREYFEALGEVMNARFPKATVSRQEGEHGRSLCIVIDDGPRSERIYLEQWGDLVLHVEGAPTQPDADGAETDATAFMLREQIMRTVERTPFEDVFAERLEDYDARRKKAEGEQPDEQAEPEADQPAQDAPK